MKGRLWSGKLIAVKNSGLLVGLRRNSGKGPVLYVDFEPGCGATDILLGFLPDLVTVEIEDAGNFC